MKARVKNSGEIVEVEKSECYCATWCNDTQIFNECELDFNLDTQQPEATISGWVARDSERAGNNLHFHRNEVKRGKFYWENKSPDRPIGESLILPKDIFPFLTWESDPIEVEIQIKPKKQ